MKPLRTKLAAALALCLVRAALAGDGVVADAGAANWYMDGGNSARTSFVDVDPVREAPVELWRRKPDEGCICEPVVWDGAVFVVSKTKGGPQVVTTLDATTGAVLARAVRLQRTGGDVRLAVWRNVLAIVEPDQTEAMTWNGRVLKPTWKGMGGTSACEFQGLLLVGGRAYDAALGAARDLGFASSAGFVMGAVSVVAAPGDRAMAVGLSIAPHAKYSGTWLHCEARYFARCSGGIATVAADGQDMPVPVAQFAGRGSPDLRRAVCVRLASSDPQRTSAWICDPSSDLATPSGKSGRLAVHVDKGPNELVPGVERPAVVGDAAYTFDDGGNLIEIRSDGSFAVVAADADLPASHRRGRMTAARGALYAGDWAFDLGTKQVLWVRDFDAKDRVGAAVVPVGDGLVAMRTEQGELVCLADPHRPTKPTAKPAVASKSEGPPPIPVTGDGVILRDGRQVLGPTQLYGIDKILVTPKDGTAQDFSVDDVLCAESDGTVLASASEAEVHELWNAALRGAVSRRYDDMALAAIEAGLYSRAAEFVEKGRLWGLSEARVAELKRKTAGKSDPALPEPRLRGLERKVGPLFDACVADVRNGAEWCGARGFRVAGAVIAARLSELDPKLDVEILAAKFAPKGLAASIGGPGVGAQWIRWAKIMLPAQAVLLEPDDVAWGRLDRRIWDDETLGFRTPNLLLFTRATDPAVVGPCLGRGEAAVRGLRQLLEPATAQRAE